MAEGICPPQLRRAGIVVGERRIVRDHRGIGLGGRLETRAVDAQQVERALQARRVHLTQIHHVRARILADVRRRRQTRRDDQRLRIGPLDRVVAGFQQLDVLGCVGRPSTPLSGQIGLVPDLIGVDATLIARCQRGEEVRPVGDAIRWPVVGEDALRAGPARVPVQAGDDPEIGVFDRLHDAVGLVPLELALGVSLDIPPLEALLDPLEPAVLSELDVAIGSGGIAPQKSVNPAFGWPSRDRRRPARAEAE